MSLRRPRSFLAVTAAVIAGLAPPAAAAPTDPFFAALPARDTQAPDALEVRDPDGSVDASTGTAAYKVPIVVPPGRQEMAPSLALSYSSQRPLRGGVAVGWGLDVGVIEKDTSVLNGTSYRVDWNGMNERLIPVTGDPSTTYTQTFRAERDPSFTRFVYVALNQTWTAYTLDGKTHSFGVHNNASRWHLSQSRDRFDNRVVYSYTWTTFTPTTGNTYGEHELTAIEYSSNPTVGLAAHARVEILRGPLAMCGAPIGAALDHHFGVLRAEGSRPIESIDVKVRSAPGASWQLRRSHRLIYDQAQLSCTTGSALRYLNRFEVTAYDPAGAATVVPPVTFTYGLPTRALTRTINAPSFGGGERGTSKGPTAMLIDMDSDGWLDRLTVAATDRCNLGIQRGTGIGTFAATTSWTPLPSARWYNSSYPTQLEGCSLSGQAADRGFTQQGENCRRESVQVTYSFQDWNGDGLVDIVSHMHETRGNSAGGDFPQSIGGPGGGTPPPCANVAPAPERVNTGGLFRLRVQRNLGQLGFDTFTNALLVASPAPMPPSPMQLNTADVVRPYLPTMIDMTGDGLVDVISLISNPGSGDLPPQPGTTPYLYVWVGTGGGTFGQMQSWAFPAPLPSWSQQYQVATPNPLQGWFLSPGTLNVNDIDGDGLPDLVVELTTGALAVVRNTGGGFRAPSLLTLGGPVDQARSEFPPAGDLPTSITNGARAFLRQLVDTDADGLPEHLVVGLGAGGVQTPAASRSALHIFGTKYATVRALGAEWEGFEELVVASNGSWHRASSAIDATGDGIVDLVEWNASGAAVIRTDGQDGVLAPRLLARVDNGRGGVTRYEYAPSTDTGVVTLAGSYLSARHVVRAIVVEPGAGQPAMTTRYSYSGPRHGTGHYLDNGRQRFLGFTTVTTDRDGRFGIGSSRSVQGFTFPSGYDRRALLTEEWTLMLPGTGGVHVPVRMKAIGTWEGLVQNGKSSFRYTSSTTERICASGATMASCISTPERSHVTTSIWTPYRATPTGPDLHYQETRTEDTATLTPARATTRTFSVRSTTSEYMQATTQVQELNGATLLSREDTVLDSRFMPNETRRYHDALTIARTQRGFDEVGNLYVEVQPRQVAAGGPGRWTSYDAHRVLVAGGTNEVGHTTYETRDVATGELLERRGPNWRYGTDEQGVTSLQFERERWTVDGLGRVVRREATFDPPAGNPSQTYVLRTVETKVYDAPLNYVSTSTIQDTATGDAIQQATALDGLGRVISTFELHGLPGLPNAVTDYHYDAGGALGQMSVPDPRVDTGAVVTYSWIRDGLGRPSYVMRPDGSGERVEHLGATTRITEIDELGHDGGVTRLVNDGRGALREVFEDGNALPTTYGYDALGRMTSMTNADGHVTSLGYDLAGHRTTITRGSRTWRVRYDLDGNPREQEAPFTSGTAGDHTTVLVHDAIGRMTQRTPATLGQPLPLRTLLGVGPTMYTYDTTRIGSLGRAEFPFGTTDFTYDARGQVRREARTVTPPAASFTIAQHVDRTYDATGAPRDVTWNDGTTWRYVNDRRGDVAEVLFHPPSSSNYTHLAIYTRGVAGVPRSRNAHGHRRDWTYDALGRVLTDRVWWLMTGVTNAERTYGYQGDEVDTVWGHTNGMVADASYSYDTQHRLTGAIGPGDYEADIGYSAAGNVTRARISGALDVPSRDVTYRYSTLDPQAVEALVAFGADVATMTYDPAGTLRQRSGSLAPALSLTWDGDEQVREATGPGGSERYLYGERGQRIAAIGANDIRVWFAESEARFTTSGAPLERWLHVAAGEPIARITNGNQVEIQHADALSNLMLAVDFTGAVTASFLYGAYGEVVASTGSENHRRQWNGKESDVVTGLRHYGFRNYDPLLLRWVSADPAFSLAPDITVEEPQRANLYAYSLNNPLRWIDPDGLNACDAGGDCKVDAPPEPKPEKAKRKQDAGGPTDTTTPSDGRGSFTGPIGDAIKAASGKDSASGKGATRSKGTSAEPRESGTTPGENGGKARESGENPREGRGKPGESSGAPRPQPIKVYDTEGPSERFELKMNETTGRERSPVKPAETTGTRRNPLIRRPYQD